MLGIEHSGTDLDSWYPSLPLFYIESMLDLFYQLERRENGI